jgi:large subunit ribosomal protein L24
MKTESYQPRKQRKQLYTEPLHLRRERVASHLSKDLKKQLGMRSVTLRTNDLVKVMRGKFKGKSGKITSVNYGRKRVLVEKVLRKKSDGTEIQVPLEPSNLLVVEIDKSDGRRFKGKNIKIEKKKEVKEEKKEVKKEEKKEEKKEVKKEEKKEAPKEEKKEVKGE